MKAERGVFSLATWAALVAVLAAVAYLTGAGLARRWMEPALALPSETQVPDRTATWITLGEPVEGTLGVEGEEEWQFQARAGQSATIEMWLHPGSGSSVEAELAVHLIGPDGTVLAREAGSVFLPPYLAEPRLPTSGSYRVRVLAVSGAPGRYSLGLTLLEEHTPIAPGVTAPAQPTATAPSGHAVAAAGKQFEWPTSQRTISGWTFRDPRNPGHIGLDIAATTWDPIAVVADGVVVFADWGGGYGNLVIVEHSNDWCSYYAHLSEVVVELGQEVRQGELVGGAGSTGHSTAPHLHFELRYQGRPVDPGTYLP